MLKSRLAKVVVAITSALVVLLEVPSIGKFFARLFAVVTGFDFFYERSKDPSWVGKVTSIALNPPPGTALLVAFIGIALIYWTTKPREIRMSPPVIGMLVSVILLAGFSVWYLVRGQPLGPNQPDSSKSGTRDAMADIDTHLSLKFASGNTPPTATNLSNVWRWYALQTRVQSPTGQQAIGWAIFLTLDKPTNVNQVVLSSNKALPVYEVKDRDARSIVIAVSGDIQDTDVEIKVLSNVPRVPLSPPAPVVIAAPEPQKTVEKAPPPAPRPHFEPEEIREIILALRQMREVYDKTLAPTYARAYSFTNGWNARLNSSGVIGVSQEARSIAEAINSGVNQLQSIANERSDYKDIFYPVIRTGHDGISDALAKLFKLANDTAELAKASGTINYSHFIEPQIPELANAVQKYGQWIDQVQANLDLTSKEFRNWKKL